jgi:hypothetical protein
VKKNGTARQATDDNIIRRMRFACWISKATDTHSEYVIRIAVPRQQWLRERASTFTCIRTLPVMLVNVLLHGMLSVKTLITCTLSPHEQ